MNIKEIPISKIRHEKKERLREDYGAISELAASFQRYGLLTPILVRPCDDGEHDWVLLDGGRRMAAVIYVWMSKNPKIKNVTPGHILAITQEDVDELYALELEFHANEDRKNFDWKEKSEYVRRIHEAHCATNPKWDAYMTAALLEMTENVLHKYLHMTQDEELFEDESVQEAESFNTAYRKLQIAKEKRLRKREAEARTKNGGEEADLESAIDKLVVQADCREWIKTFDDEHFDWFHWDPPYGGEQAGGARPTHAQIDDTEAYAWGLIRGMVREIWRVLKDGSWLVMWYHPKFQHRLVGLLQGHEFAGGVCKLCGSGWDDIHSIYLCPKSPTPFWVNPYPYIWYKKNRLSDGHEIKRFSVNAYEPFLLACKIDEKEPILMQSMTQNVFPWDVVSKTERQHSTQKAVGVLMQILPLISVPGSLGGDAGVGSGSIIEAAFRAKRSVVGVEIDEDYYFIARDAARRGILNWGKELPGGEEVS